MAVEGCYFYRGERDRGGGVTTEENRRELLLLERRNGVFSAGLVLVVFVE